MHFVYQTVSKLLPPNSTIAGKQQQCFGNNNTLQAASVINYAPPNNQYHAVVFLYLFNCQSSYEIDESSFMVLLVTVTRGGFGV